MSLFSFTPEDTESLVNDGFNPGYIKDVKEGDEIALAPMLTMDGGAKRYSLLRQEKSYGDGHVVHSLIVINEDGMPEHKSLGQMIPCFYKPMEDTEEAGAIALVLLVS